MDTRHKEKLQMNFDLIAKELDVEHVLLYLSGTVLTSFEVDKVRAPLTREARAKRLLDFLLTKDAVAYQHFRYVLRDKYAPIVQKLDNTAAGTSHIVDGAVIQNRILKRRDSLILNLQTDDLTENLQQEGVLTTDDCNNVRAGATKVDKARILVDLLSSKGPQACKTFSLAVKARQPQLAKIFENVE